MCVEICKYMCRVYRLVWACICGSRSRRTGTPSDLGIILKPTGVEDALKMIEDLPGLMSSLDSKVDTIGSIADDLQSQIDSLRASSAGTDTTQRMLD